MIRLLGLGLAIAFAPAVAVAQAAPSPAQSASAARAQAASPSPTPNAIGPALKANDPCTSMSAIVSRPTVTNSVCTVRPNHVLVETGYQNTTSYGAGNAVVYPQTLIRIGTSIPALELDFSPPEVQRSGGLAGPTDAGAGLKYVLGYTPKSSYGAQVFITVPTGLTAFSANETQSTYALTAGYAFNAVLSVAAGASLASLAAAEQRYTSFTPSLVLTAALPSSNSVYAEIATFSSANGPGTATRTQYIVGGYHDVGQRLQLDAEIGFSPTMATGRYHYIGAGISYYL